MPKVVTSAVAVTCPGATSARGVASVDGNLVAVGGDDEAGAPGTAAHRAASVPQRHLLGVGNDVGPVRAGNGAMAWGFGTTPGDHGRDQACHPSGQGQGPSAAPGLLTETRSP